MDPSESNSEQIDFQRLRATAVLNGPLPVYLRLPKRGSRCPVCGLSRSTLCALILGPDAPVESKTLIRPGRGRGVRLIDTVSLLRYLGKQPDLNNSTGEAPETKTP
jgi:hypothetical protein